MKREKTSPFNSIILIWFRLINKFKANALHFNGKVLFYLTTMPCHTAINTTRSSRLYTILYVCSRCCMLYYIMLFPPFFLAYTVLCSQFSLYNVVVIAVFFFFFFITVVAFRHRLFLFPMYV